MKKTLLIFLSGLLMFSLNSMAQNTSPFWSLAGNSNAATTSKLGTTNTVSLRFYTNNVQRMIINSAAGYVGIGTTSPVNILTVQSGGSTPAAAWLNGLNSPVFAGFGEVVSSEFLLAGASNTAINRAVFQGRRSRGTLAAPTVVANNDYITSLLASAYDGSNFQNPALVSFFVDGTPTPGNVPAGISFVTGSNTGNRTERLKIGSIGNFDFNNGQVYIQQLDGSVGIGTKTPTSKLDVAGTITGFDSYFGSRFPVSAGTSGASYSSVGYGLTFTGITANYLYRVDNDYSSMLSFRAGGFDFNTAPVGTAGNVIPYTTAMRIEQNRNVGIGTLTPANRLSVAGNADFTGNVAIGDPNLAIYPLYVVSHNIANRPVAYIENTVGLSGVRGEGLYIKAGTNSSAMGSNFIAFITPTGTNIGGIQQTSVNGVTYFTTSDKRLKNIIGASQKGLADLMKIKIYDYSFKSDPQKKVLTGFMAQELYEIFPQSVSKPRDNNEPAEKNPWMVDYGSVTPLIIKSVQEQQQIIDELKESNDDLKKQNENLEERILKLETALQSLTANNGNILNVVTNASLEQNTPNPFSKNTIIRYGIPQGSKGQINVYDLAGKLVKTLKANAGGLSQVNGQDLAAGAYTYTLMVDGKVALSKQMVIVK